MQEFLDLTLELTAKNGSIRGDFVFDLSLLNYDHTNSTMYPQAKVREVGLIIYQVLKNSLGALSNYLIQMSSKYISDTII